MATITVSRAEQTTGRIRVMTWMRHNCEDHRDRHTGEINDTALAEDACREFDGYGPGPEYNIPELYFEWAFLVGEAAEGKGTPSAAVRGIIGRVPSDYL